MRSSSIKMSPFSSESPPLLVLESLVDTSTNSNLVYYSSLGRLLLLLYNDAECILS